MNETNAVEQEYLDAINMADAIIYSVTTLLSGGPGNQWWNNNSAGDLLGDATAFKTAAQVHNVRELKKQYYNEQYSSPDPFKHYTSAQQATKVNKYSPRLSALAAIKHKVGNCLELSDLTYVLCREYFPNTWSVAKVATNPIYDHVLVVVWKNSDPSGTNCSETKRRSGNIMESVMGAIAIDPWPRYSQALFWADHFCFKYVKRKTLTPANWGLSIQPHKLGKGSPEKLMETSTKWSDFLRSNRQGNLAWAKKENARAPEGPINATKLNLRKYDDLKTLTPKVNKTELTSDELTSITPRICNIEYSSENKKLYEYTLLTNPKQQKP